MRLHRVVVGASVAFFVLSLVGRGPGDVFAGERGYNMELTREAASSFARLALGCVHKEYPNKPGHVMNDEKEILNPQALHPVFYGCFDWHSCVHGHWMLAHLLRLFPDLPEAGDIRFRELEDFHPDRLYTEVPYFEKVRAAAQQLSSLPATRPAPPQPRPPIPAPGLGSGNLLDQAHLAGFDHQQTQTVVKRIPHRRGLGVEQV